MIDRDLLKQALEALELGDAADAISVGELMDAIREALAQPEQEPVAWKDRTYGNLHHQDFGNSIPLYTTPQPNTIANSEAIPEQISEPVAWRDHVEQRLLTWRQSFVNRSGDQLALDDFMDKESLDDLIDYVCDEYTTPPPNTIANSEAIPEQISEHSSDCALLQIPSRDCDCGA